MIDINENSAKIKCNLSAPPSSANSSLTFQIGIKSFILVIGLALEPVLIKTYTPNNPIPSNKNILIAVPILTTALLSPILFVLKNVTSTM